MSGPGTRKASSTTSGVSMMSRSWRSAPACAGQAGHVEIGPHEVAESRADDPLEGPIVRGGGADAHAPEVTGQEAPCHAPEVAPRSLRPDRIGSIPELTGGIGQSVHGALGEGDEEAGRGAMRRARSRCRSVPRSGLVTAGVATAVSLTMRQR